MYKKSSTNRISASRLAIAGVLTSLSLIVFLIENLLPPLFLPGARLGLANVFSLTALILLGPWDAFAVVIVRTVLGSLLAGNISALLYSLAGGLASMAVSCILFYGLYPKISLVSISIVAAVCHNVIQDLVFVVLYRSSVMLSYLPYFALIGILSGCLIGVVVVLVIKNLPQSFIDKRIQQSKTDPSVS